jgi:predicted glycosyltransferase
MRILIDAGHPAHVHLFRFLSDGMSAKGHEIIFTYRKKEHEKHLLDKFKLRNICIGNHHATSAGKILGLPAAVIRMYFLSLKFKPDLFLSHGSLIAAWTSWLYRRPNIALEDTGNKEQVRLYLPFTEAVLTPASFQNDYGYKQIRYDGFHELAYLRPPYFNADTDLKNRLGISGDSKIIIARFISWSATHDRGATGLTDTEKYTLVTELSKFGKVYISSEAGVPSSLREFLYPLEPETIHQALANADLYIGEGATMASESCILGTPSIYINPIYAGTIRAQEKYGLLFQFMDFGKSLEKAKEILTDRESSEKFHMKRNQMLNETIDLTKFLIWFISDWPASFRRIKADPSFQVNF